MKTIETKVYTFEELNDAAKDKARQWWLELGLDNWYEDIEDDAKTVGINLKSFDTDSASFIRDVELDFIESALTTLELILEHHGKDCDTYKAAEAFEAALDALPALPKETAPDYAEIERRLCESNDAAESDFLTALTHCYAKMLQQELEHQQSNEYVDETIIANEYTFTEDGKRFG